ncbi:axin-1-like isoform X3 [Denticeps clupeoides]|uniref:axin-1-like isoform X3 n=1 Tax=Denticeps clupeoides TaxID=299321 RepID=UPI0010A3EF85|nr:axin-1-like isoform X3 [Denticeps clupeoides]
MSVRIRSRHADLGGRFDEDAPRPPVPGMEGDLAVADHGRPCHHGLYATKGDSFRAEGSVATPRRSDLDLGYEPEGSASPTPPYLKWAESLHSLLDDQDGIQLFRSFLQQEDCGDLLDFWFACVGFRKLPGGSGDEEKRLKLAKVIYRKYVVDGSGIVSRKIKPATKSFIRDCVMRLHLDAAMFDQAQTEIQALMEENTYPLFLKSDVYLEYARAGGESPMHCGGGSGGAEHGSASPSNLKTLPGYLPTLMEDKEWREESEQDHAPASRLTQQLLMETAPHRATANRKYPESFEFSRHGPWREPVNPYYVNMGYARAPATSANDSEQQSMSSDADTISLTDSSVDGVPPYRFRKQHRRDMQESANANGRVPLPHIPRTHRLPKDVHVEPQKFAAELISRLEAVQREREAQERLEERLKRVRMEEEGDDADVSMATTVSSNHKLPPAPAHYAPRYPEAAYNGIPSRDVHDEDPESILDEHVQRVMKTPGCQSPRSPPNNASAYGHKHAYHPHHAGREPLEADAAPRLQSSYPWNGEGHHYGGKGRSYGDGHGTAPGAGAVDALGYGKGSTLSRRGLKAKDVARSEEGRGLDSPVSLEDSDQKLKILQWMMEGEKESGRHKKSSHGLGVFKRGQATEAGRPGSGANERGGAGAHQWAGPGLRGGHQPSHLFIQDPSMPPNPAPNPLTQLEEAKRRLEEERRRNAALQSKSRHKPTKKPPSENLTVAYYFCGEPIPYRTSVKGRVVTLGQFKELLTKKGMYRFYFKKVSDEFDCGVVFEEVREDDAILPIFEERIIGKVEKID